MLISRKIRQMGQILSVICLFILAACTTPPTVHLPVTQTPIARISSVEIPGLAEGQGFLNLNVQWPDPSFQIQIIPRETARLTVRITAPGQKEIVQTVNRFPGSLTSRYRLVFMVLPAGNDRTITVEAHDSAGHLLASGQKNNLTIQPNTFNHAAITLQLIGEIQPLPTPSPIPGQPTPTPSPSPSTSDQAPVVSGINTALSLKGANYSGTLTAVASDPESRPLSYQWSANGGKLLNNGTAVVNWEGHGGTYTFIVAVSDGTNTTSFSRKVVLTSNQPPVISGLQANMTFNAPFHTGTLTASGVTDPEGDSLTYQWKLGNGLGNLSQPNGLTTSWSNAPSGNHVVTFEVSDGLNTTSKAITVQLPNQSPLISSLNTALSETTPGTHSGTLTVQASDPEGDTLSYNWTVSGGTLSASGSTVNWQGSAGSYTATVTVSDGKGGSTSQSKNFVRVNNKAPVVNTVSANITENPLNAFNGSLGVVATDPEGQAMTFSWGGSNSAILATTTGQTVSLKANTGPGDYALTVSANDGSLTSVTYAFLLKLVSANRPPVIQSLVPNISFNGSNHQGTIVASASDPDGQPLNYTWSLTQNPGGSLTGSGNTVNFSGTEGTYTVSLTVSDGSLLSNPFSLTFALTDPNNKPVVTAISDSGFNFNSSTGLHTGTLNAVASDADGDSLSYTWSVSGGSLSSSSGNPVTFSAPAGTYNVSVQANDGTDLSTAFTRQIILTNPNNKPTVSSVIPNLTFNGSQYTGTLTVSASDPDNDALSYSWQVISGNSSLGSNSGQTVNWTASPGSHTVRVIANDGKDNSNPYDYQTTLSVNNPPVISDVLVDYTNGYFFGGTTFQRNLTAMASDPDGDALSYSWSVNSGSPAGTFYQATTPPTSPSNTQTSSQNPIAYRADKNTVYGIRVTVSDGTNQASFTKTVLLGNQLPYVQSANYNVSCNNGYQIPVTITTTDPDGHPITAIVWSVNNGSLSGTTGTSNTWFIPTAGTWRLTIKTSDAYGTGTTNIDLTVSGCG